MSSLPFIFQAIRELVASPVAGGLTPDAGSFGGVQVARARYSFATDGGVIGPITPALTVSLPAGAILVGGIVHVRDAVLAPAGSATVAIGTTAGSSASALLAATAKATLSANAVLPLVPTNAIPVRLTATGSVNFTVATAALTAGIIDAWIFFLPAVP